MRSRWFTTLGLVVSGSACAIAALASGGGATTLQYHAADIPLSPATIAGFIAALTIGALAILRPWRYRRENESRAWGLLVAIVCVILFGGRFVHTAGPELAPVGWFLMLGAFVCVALIGQSFAADLRTRASHRPEAPAARVIKRR